MNEKQKDLMKEKLWSTFRLFGFAIGINIVSSLIVFIVKIASGNSGNMSFIDDWLLKVILPLALSLIMFLSVFLIEWKKITHGDYSNIKVTYENFCLFIKESKKLINDFENMDNVTKSTKIEQLVKNTMFNISLIIFNPHSDVFNKIEYCDRSDVLLIENFIGKNSNFIDSKADFLIEWQDFSKNPKYIKFVEGAQVGNKGH
ncbi:MAG: hypothetical protein LKE36_00655 [Bacilli bacterium]|jgi:hypothetical protein|nr:hypothetical protein [Bacilli bacterium]